MLYVALLGLGLLAFVFVAWRAWGLLVASVLLLTLSTAGFGLAYLAMVTDYRDADGFVDCSPGCSAVQELTGVGLVVGPLGILIALGAGIVATVSRRRS